MEWDVGLRVPRGGVWGWVKFEEVDLTESLCGEFDLSSAVVPLIAK